MRQAGPLLESSHLGSQSCLHSQGWKLSSPEVRVLPNRTAGSQMVPSAADGVTRPSGRTQGLGTLREKASPMVQPGHRAQLLMPTQPPCSAGPCPPPVSPRSMAAESDTRGFQAQCKLLLSGHARTTGQRERDPRELPAPSRAIPGRTEF